ncbi:hypothetical protein MEX01_50590 [Methylorubrum extorquens]|uniref:type IV secretion system DNA-binding domain-containing protein n=1 Tax=Methylorubrum extorquens TaxID=408 RepID=UPI0011752CE9|nr:type IV secretion system DNA-binding domain-containing protein [Methylorubrum extorquens]GEL44468.1 hypothetical protein MEX01_50590 [Methylorubrum extorquens]
MINLTGRIGTAPCRSRDKAVFAALKVIATVFPLGLLAVMLWAPPRAYAGRHAPTIDITQILGWLGDSWFDFALELRCAGVLLAAIVAGLFAAWQAWTRTPLIERIGVPHHDDPALHYGVYAAREMQGALDETYGRTSKRGLWLTPGVQLPFEAETQFILVVGDKGSGKSNVVRALATQMAQRGDRMLLHCVKGDVTRAFRQNEAVLIAAHHARGWAWDAGRDVVGLAGFMELAAAAIPMSDQPFWALTARAVFVDIGQELALERGTDWTIDDLARRILSDPAEIEARILRLDLSSSPLIAEGPDGLANTAFGVLATLWSAALSALRPLAFAWADFPLERRFSIRAWLSKDWTGPRAVILQTSPEYEELSRLVSGTLLNRLVSLMSDPAIGIDPDRRVSLVLDEMHSLGRIDGFDQVLALGREKGLVVVGAIQSLGQLKTIYGSEVGAVVQDLFRYRIFSLLSSGESSDTAVSLIGHRTVTWRAANEAPEPNDKRKWILKEGTRPVVSVSTLQGALGVKVVREAIKDKNGKELKPALKEVRGVVTGFKDVYRVAWPITVWPERQKGYVPAGWLTAPRRLAAPAAQAAAASSDGADGS